MFTPILIFYNTRKLILFVLGLSLSDDSAACDRECSILQLQNDLKSNKLSTRFREVPQYFSDCKTAEMGHNSDKNRYTDILPYDTTRYRLQSKSDYINGNHVIMHVGGGHVHKWIATQGPMANTINDFWKMVMESETELIVMVTELLQNNREKSAKYWPKLNMAMQISDLAVVRTVLEIKTNDGVIEREFEIESSNTCGDTFHRTIKHLQFIDWPDHGVPNHSSNFLSFFRTMQNYQTEHHPTIIHCSAGVGRTGVTIGLAAVTSLLEHGLPVDPIETVYAMRRQRACLIQTTEQFLFLCNIVIQLHESMQHDGLTLENNNNEIKHIEL